MKSMTKDGRIVAQSFVAGRGIARAEVRIAAAISVENSSVRWGQPANPPRIPAPIAIVAKRTRPERRGGIRIQTASDRSARRFT